METRETRPAVGSQVMCPHGRRIVGNLQTPCNCFVMDLCWGLSCQEQKYIGSFRAFLIIPAADRG